MAKGDGISRRGVMAAAGGVAAGAALTRAGAVSAAAAPAPVLPPLPVIWGQARSIPLWPKGVPGSGFTRQPAEPGDTIYIRNVAAPDLRVFRPRESNGRALLSIPGGAYRLVSIVNEGVDVAARMTAKGYTVFVLTYRLPGEGWANRADVPLQDAQRAMRMIRSVAGEYGFDPAQVSVVGFSAGGHLAASLATGFAEPLAPGGDAIDRLDARPATAALIYPVISHAAGVGHALSTHLLLGDAPDAALVARRSPALHVTAQTPPTFLVHSLDDPAVPAENSRVMMRALEAAKRPVEAHFFQEGGHGYGTGDPALPAHYWPDLLAAWIARQRR